MAVVLRATSSLTTVRSEFTSAGNGAPAPANRNPLAAARPFLSVSKPSWVVRTESNVRKESIPKPDPPCVVCRGSGRVNCHNCNGRGRTNHIEMATLPKGEWPKWCRSCGGSGLGYCNRCHGTGEYRRLSAFNLTCMCYRVSGTVIPQPVLSAAGLYRIALPQVGQCQGF